MIHWKMFCLLSSWDQGSFFVDRRSQMRRACSELGRWSCVRCSISDFGPPLPPWSDHLFQGVCGSIRRNLSGSTAVASGKAIYDGLSATDTRYLLNWTMAIWYISMLWTDHQSRQLVWLSATGHNLNDYSYQTLGAQPHGIDDRLLGPQFKRQFGG